MVYSDPKSFVRAGSVFGSRSSKGHMVEPHLMGRGKQRFGSKIKIKENIFGSDILNPIQI